MLPDVFLIEWQLPECEPVIEKTASRSEAHELIEKMNNLGAEILGIWAGQKWYLWPNGEIKILSQNGSKIKT